MSDSLATIEAVIITIQNQKMILDADLAKIYGVPTRVLNQAIKRNRRKFPLDFMIQISHSEAKRLQSSRSQSVIMKQGHNLKYRPYAFTEYGAIMAANVLNSPRAIQMSVFVVRAFVRMRTMISERQELSRQLADLEKALTSRLDIHESAIVDVLKRVMILLDPPPTPPLPKKLRIGFRR